LDPLIKSQQFFKLIQPVSKNKAVKPAANGQWLSWDLSNLARSPHPTISDAGGNP
jgi:hypothetical protein